MNSYTNNDSLRLTRIEVKKLFGYYDHDVQLQLHDRVTILHGTNGVGKTSLLRMVNALLNGELGYFFTIPFERIALHFEEGQILILELLESNGDSEETHRLSLIHSKTVVCQETNIALTKFSAKYIAENVEYLRPYQYVPETWIDIRDDELLSASEVVRRFSATKGITELANEENLNWLREFLRGASTHFIKEQRLMINRTSASPRRFYSGEPPLSVPTVLDCARHFRRKLDDTMAEYGRTAQILDQSFPQRVISSTERMSLAKLKTSMEMLDKKTAALKDIGILDETPTHPFDVSSLDSSGDATHMLVMTLYVQDTEAKLEALEDLRNRTAVFFDIINGKFRHKRLRLDRVYDKIRRRRAP